MKIFEQIKEQDKLYLIVEDDFKIYTCNVLKIQQLLTWKSLTQKSNERSIFIDWNGRWLDLQFIAWNTQKKLSIQSFKHLNVFTNKNEASTFMKDRCNQLLTSVTAEKHHLLDLLSITYHEDDINDLRKRITEIESLIVKCNNILKELS